MTFKVGDRILLSSHFAGPAGPVDLGAFPVVWGCPTGEAVVDPKYPNGVSTTGEVVFIAVKGGTSVNLRFNDVKGGPSHFGAAVDIEPMPQITAQSAIVEGKVLP